jgi:hypothetical protein
MGEMFREPLPFALPFTLLTIVYVATCCAFLSEAFGRWPTDYTIPILRGLLLGETEE